MNKVPRILVVEDEPAIQELIAVNLRHNGLSPIWAEDGERAQREIDTVLPDVILLDWMLPGQSGVSLARKWRADPRTKAIPILMLTARTDENDKVSGLDAGADDYITKPIRPKVLVSRVKALLRRNVKDSEPVGSLERGDLMINLEKYQVFKDGSIVEMPRKEFELLHLLASKPGKVFSRDSIMDRVWGSEVIVGGRTIDVHIRKIREKIGDETIKTIKGVGYKFEE